LSFFDEADDEPRRADRTAVRRPRPSGRGRPPGDQQAIQTRRTVAIVVIVVVVVVMALLIHSCQVSERNSSLKSYTNDVYSLIGQSDATGAAVFKELGSTGGSNNATGAYSAFVALAKQAQSEFSTANNLSVPGEMSTAQANLLQVMRLRRDGVEAIADNIEPALGTTDQKSAIDQITGATSRFYASDVIYKTYVTPEMASALNSARIPFGGTTGPSINGGQFVHDLGWLQATFIATELGSSYSTGGGGSGINAGDSDAPGLHGHALTAVAVGSTQIISGGTETVSAKPAPTFTLSITNGGTFTEYNVGCKVSIKGLNDTGTTVLPQTTPNESTTCSVTLPHAPTPGSYTVTAEVVPVPGETNTANNYLTSTITFTS
jgi:hypothetical protein